MATKITKCDNCESTNISELNPDSRVSASTPLCTINCICNECGFLFEIKSWTHSGKRYGILY